MSLPYRWSPLGADRLSVSKRPEVGTLVPFEHRVWRIFEVRDLPEDRWTDTDRLYRLPPFAITLRPIECGDDARDRDHDIHLKYGPGVRGTLYAYPDDHYPMCAQCAEPLPCREQMVERTAAAAEKHAARYEMTGICPSCQEPVTARQQSIRFAENVEVLLGPPVIYHLRRTCRSSAAEYEKRWAAADPENRRTRLSCKGAVINHNDGTYECSELIDCPGPDAEHRSYRVCRCPDCHARGRFGCYPSPNAQLLTDRGVA